MLAINNREELRLLRALVVIAASIVLLNIINQIIGKPFWQINRLIYLGYEGNFTTWFSSLLLTIASFFAYRCSTFSQISRVDKRRWWLLSLGLLGMSCDETAQMHEHFGDFANKYFFKLQGLEHTSWIVICPFLLLIILFLVNYFKKCLIGSKKAQIFLGAGIVIFIAGACCLEATINFLNHQDLEWLWKIEVVFEEGFEMLGVLLIIKGLIEHYHLLTHKTKFN